METSQLQKNTVLKDNIFSSEWCLFVATILINWTDDFLKQNKCQVMKRMLPFDLFSSRQFQDPPRAVPPPLCHYFTQNIQIWSSVDRCLGISIFFSFWTGGNTTRSLPDKDEVPSGSNKFPVVCCFPHKTHRWVYNSDGGEHMEWGNTEKNEKFFEKKCLSITFPAKNHTFRIICIFSSVGYSSSTFITRSMYAHVAACFFSTGGDSIYWSKFICHGENYKYQWCLSKEKKREDIYR